MSALTTAAIIAAVIGEGVSAAASVYGANKASNAATQAAQLQTGLGEQGLQAMQNAYQTQQANFAPYLQAGQQSAATLGALLNPNKPYTAGSVPTSFPGGPLSPGLSPHPQALTTPQVQMSQLGTTGAPPVSPGQSLLTPYPAQFTGNVPAATVPGAPGAPNTGPLVTVQGPNGSVQLPMAQAQQYVGRPGFQVMG